MQIYTRNEGDGWRWQGDLTFVAKKGNDHKRMRSISGPRRLRDLTGCDQKVSRLHVAVCDTPNVHKSRADTSCRIRARATSLLSGST